MEIEEADETAETSERARTKSPPSITLYAAWSAIFAAITGSWQYGYAIGSVNAAYRPITNSVEQYYEDRYNNTVTPDVVEAVWITLSAAFPFGGIFGALLVGPVARRFGRLGGMLMGHVITLLMSLLCGISGVLMAPELIIISRLGLGLSAATVGTGITVMYIAEVSPRHLRGVFGTMISSAIGVGLTVSNTLGLPQVFGNETLWPLLLALIGLPSLVFVVLMKTLSPSPRKLFLEDNDRERATKTLQRLRGVDDVSGELEEMEAEHRQSHSKVQLTVVELMNTSSLRPAVVAAVVLAAAQQITGLNGVSFNMNNIYIEAGFKQESVYYITIGVNVLVLSLSLLSASLVEKYGRKILLLTGYATEGFSLILLAITIETKHLSNVLPYISVAASLGFWIGFALGPGPVTLLTVAEFFDQSSRSAAVTLASVVLWIAFTIAVIATPYMLAAMHGYTFLPFGIFALMAFGFIRFYVPETKNKPFSEIQNSFGTDQRAPTKSREDETGAFIINHQRDTKF